MPLTSYFLFMSNCITRAILKLVEDLESGVYINVNEHYKGKRNIEITLLYGFDYLIILSNASTARRISASGKSWSTRLFAKYCSKA